MYKYIDDIFNVKQNDWVRINSANYIVTEHNAT